jgi:hypothetical protein
MFIAPGEGAAELLSVELEGKGSRAITHTWCNRVNHTHKSMDMV